MVSEKQNFSQDKLAKFSEALAEARKMQHDWMTHGLDFVDLYVEDMDGDWLERWGEDEEDLVSEAQDAPVVAVGQTLVGGAAIEAVTAFLESNDSVAVQVRERLGDKSLPEIAVELENCLSSPEEDDRLLAIKNVLAGGITADGTNRDLGDNKAEIELLDLAESLLEKLSEFWS